MRLGRAMKSRPLEFNFELQHRRGGNRTTETLDLNGECTRSVSRWFKSHDTFCPRDAQGSITQVIRRPRIARGQRPSAPGCRGIARGQRRRSPARRFIGRGQREDVGGRRGGGRGRHLDDIGRDLVVRGQ
jgi:hypothetical protein